MHRGYLYVYKTVTNNTQINRNQINRNESYLQNVTPCAQMVCLEIVISNPVHRRIKNGIARALQWCQHWQTDQSQWMRKSRTQREWDDEFVWQTNKQMFMWIIEQWQGNCTNYNLRFHLMLLTVPNTERTNSLKFQAPYLFVQITLCMHHMANGNCDLKLPENLNAFSQIWSQHHITHHITSHEIQVNCACKMNDFDDIHSTFWVGRDFVFHSFHPGFCFLRAYFHMDLGLKFRL